MIDKFSFHLDGYTEGGGNSEEGSGESNPPRNYVITISSEYAKYILRRIALVRQVRKVDEMIYSMHYAFHDGTWCYDVSTQADGIIAIDNASTTQDYMIVKVNEIQFICYHESSGQCLATEPIGHIPLRKLAAGKHPFQPDQGIDEEDEESQINAAVGTWNPPSLGSIPTPVHLTPMQMLQQAAMANQQQVNLPSPEGQVQFPGEVVELQFDTAMPQWTPPLPTPEPEVDNEPDDGPDGEPDHGDPGDSNEE